VNKTPLVVIGVLAVLLLVVGVATSSSSEEEAAAPPPPAPVNARAVLVASDDAERTVVVLPCSASQTARDIQVAGAVADSIRLTIPQGSGSRAVLVPDCRAPDKPTAAFVLPEGQDKAIDRKLALNAQSQIIVPSGSPARTIVVPSCGGTEGGEGPVTPSEQGADVVLSPAEGDDSATAPAC